MNKKIFISSLLFAIGFTSLFGFSTGLAFDFLSKFSVDLPLQSVSFSRGGDMQGSTHGMSIEKFDSNSALVCYKDANWHHEVIQVKEYLVPVYVLEDIKTIFNNNKLVLCEKAPKSKYQVLDGATTGYSFTFTGRRISFSTNQELPVESYDALREISKYVADACAKGQRLPGLVFEKDQEGYMPRINPIEKGKVIIKVVGYRKNVLNIAIGNGTEEEKLISLQSKITEIARPEHVVAERLTDDTYKLSQNYTYNYSWELEKRLETGKYCLTLGDYTTEFEIQ